MSDSESSEAFVEQCSACEVELDVSGFEPFTNVICPHCETETRVKRQLGSYYLEGRHAAGGMSVVYRATDQTLGREVAVKVLNAEYSVDETRVVAFETEARLTASVNHPNVVRVYTVGRGFDRFYLVMEMLEGQSFEMMMRERGALPEDEVLDVALQVAEGLKAANEAGVLHRDVKPGNILLNDRGTAKLVDFGLALITQGGSVQAEEVWATPYYVPPEALEKGEEDFRSDVYAFGASLYHALYGKPPLETTTTNRKALRRAKQTIPRLVKVAPWLGDDTCETVDRMMAFSPKNRWGSYDELIKALTKARQHARPVSGMEEGGESRARRRRKRNRYLMPMVAGAVALGLVGAFLLWKPWDRKVDGDDGVVVDPTPVESKLVDAGSDASGRISEAWAKGRTLVTSGKFREAEKAFLELADGGGVSEPSASLARMEAVVSCYLDGRPDEGRVLAKTIGERLKTDKSDAGIELRDLAMVLSEVSLPRADGFLGEQTGIIGGLGQVAVGLKFWEQGMAQEAVARFEKVGISEIQRDYEWYEVYQKMVRVYVEDAEVMEKVDQFRDPDSVREVEEQLSMLQEIRGKLKTKGRMAYNLKSRQVYLARLKKGFELRPNDRGDLNWAELTKLIRERVERGDFSGARELLDNGKGKTEAGVLNAWEYLLDGGVGFQNRLKGSDLGDGALLESGAVISWKDVALEDLLSAHMEMIEAASEKTALKVERISFLWLTGSADEAEAEAEALAGEDEAFLKRWRQVLIGLSQ